jgi:hypothetical protein
MLLKGCAHTYTTAGALIRRAAVHSAYQLPASPPVPVDAQYLDSTSPVVPVRALCARARACVCGMCMCSCVHPQRRPLAACTQACALQWRPCCASLVYVLCCSSDSSSIAVTATTRDAHQTGAAWAPLQRTGLRARSEGEHRTVAATHCARQPSVAGWVQCWRARACCVARLLRQPRVCLLARVCSAASTVTLLRSCVVQQPHTMVPRCVRACAGVADAPGPPADAGAPQRPHSGLDAARHRQGVCRELATAPHAGPAAPPPPRAAAHGVSPPPTRWLPRCRTAAALLLPRCCHVRCCLQVRPAL